MRDVHQRGLLLTVVLAAALAGTGSRTRAAITDPDHSCIKLPPTEDEIYDAGTFWSYEPSTGSLVVDLFPVLKVNACAEAERQHHHVRVDLVSTSATSASSTSSHKFSCYRLDKDSFVQTSAVINVSTTSVTFDNVDGLYFLRLLHCTTNKTGGSCRTIKGDARRVYCVADEDKNGRQRPLQFNADSKVKQQLQQQNNNNNNNANVNNNEEALKAAAASAVADVLEKQSKLNTVVAVPTEAPKPESTTANVCELEVPSKVSVDLVEPAVNDEADNNTSHGNVSADATTAADDFCDINVRAFIPACAALELDNTVTLTVVDAVSGDASCTFDDFELKEKNTDQQIKLQSCNGTAEATVFDNSSATTRLPMCDDTPNLDPSLVLDHNVMGLSRNSSYCLFFRLNGPRCTGHFRCVFYTEVISCGLIEASSARGRRRGNFRMQAIVTEPVFIAGVSLILIASLALLAWTVIQCSKKKPGTPLMTQTQSGMMKKPPRSLTEDDLEHISRLPSQEIVLVYFPDTNRFKELNRKLRNWLITLDVNDVKDIYDEKTTEEVLRNPEQWVRETLAGPEKRVILVCSRLAYECLTAVKRGISSPRFVESDPHFGLLTRTIQYLDREMRGNYRNLICVRYEDLKICSRQYSSEAFNLVPGTEYCLPQHLEDICRWIHPRRPNPDFWAETKPEVSELYEAIRSYRNHDENIFTVQFSAANLCAEQLQQQQHLLMNH